MEKILNYIDSKKDEHLAQLIEFLKFPSISSDSNYINGMKDCANWLVEQIKSIGFKNVGTRKNVATIKQDDGTIIEREGHPIVYGEWLEAGPDAKTILVYGHYDVQPVDPINLWHSKPFEPEIRDGRLYGRGTADDKGQLFCHIKSLEAYMKVYGKLPVNVKLLFEGEEEAESSLDEFIAKNQDLLKCDYVVISDTEWFAEGVPSICYGLRGIAYVEVKVTGQNRDLHSGTFGGAVDNPLQVLAWMITQLKDKYGRVTVPEFYDDVVPLTEEERKEFAKLPFDDEEYRKDLEVGALSGEIGYTTLERVWCRPSLDVHGIIGGYTGEGAKTVISTTASAKISTRLVPHQNPEKISRDLANYLRKIAPPTVKVEVTELHYGSPVLLDMKGKGITAAIDALKEAFGKEVVFMREGGSIPIVSVFKEVLKAPSVLMGLGLPKDNIHSPNESLKLENFFGGIRASALFFNNMK
ncbi:MAG: dipeptidase [Bacteroidetes bacterium]|nr:dipeptidase [Bacteroidota bacterium]